ncbi:5-oxoprolinase subunit PxpA [Microbacterium sp. MPKO10]|uniref:5-oxoprolinase subunit PxpA n=1 Tax=Microbacterium sp. MPKO10 TaxID=2989818 RepID=UPI0022361EBA|nr:5-oxoprolinase subunit PxpA [Microbacterium sp. MPKO10]MCW4456627.1 LamB/YcsF family protein [Microbacterium sp. MPKO10]
MDLNCDLGETVDGQPTADDAAMFAHISSANVACGFHAGDADSMRRSCELAVRHNVVVGAHVSYRDRENFGRVDSEIDRATLVSHVVEQIETLNTIADAAGTAVRYVKPHGALYNRIARDPERADAVAEAVARSCALPIMGLPDSRIADAASAHGLRFIREAFVDRGYRADGTLVPRNDPGALLAPDAVAERAVAIVAEHEVIAATGERVRLDVDSLCVHGDTPGAVQMAADVRAALERDGIAIEAVSL